MYRVVFNKYITIKKGGINMNLTKINHFKIYIILLCIFPIAIISGCSNNKYTSEYSTSTENTKITDFNFDNNKGQYYMPNGSAAAENGYYYITKNSYTSNNSEPTYGYFIYYYDMTSQTTVPLCSKLECQHNDSNCDAYLLENECLGHMIWFYNDRIYMLERTKENDNLVSYDKEGRNKKNICILSDNDAVVGFKNSVDNVACVNNGSLYYETYNSKNDFVEFKKVDLKSESKPQVIGTVPINPNTLSTNVFRFYPFQDKVYIFENQYVSASDTTNSIYEYDVNKNNLSSLIEFKYGDISSPYRGTIYNWNTNMVVDNDGNFYYITELDGDKIPASIGTGYNKTCIINKYNVLLKTNSELYVLEGTSDKIGNPDSLIINGYDGTYIYFFEYQISSTIKKKSNLIEDSNNLIVMNTNGIVIDKIHFTVNSEYLDSYFKNWAAGSIRFNKIIPGDRYIMLATTVNAITGIERSDKYMKAYIASKNFTETEVLAVLDKNQIGTGTHTWIKVKE